MIAIADVVEDLLKKPRPVLCLDTCDFLDVVRSLMRDGDQLSNVLAFSRIISTLAVAPERLQLVVTYLVPHEWKQNLDGVRDEAEKDLKTTNDKIALIAKACNQLRIGVSLPPPFAVGPLVQGLIDLAERLMNQSFVLEKDGGCVEYALERLMDKRRPSHGKEIKDSINLEHYIELCRGLRQGGFSERCIFVSSNKSDFWQKDPQYTPKIHPDLSGELAAVGLEFFGKLNAAVGELRI